jgi:transcriptional regulator with XRE-family HTH domain
VTQSHEVDVAKRIKDIRTAKKLSRRALADRLEVTYLQVWRFETGKTRIDTDTAARIADALGVTVAYLYRKAA